MKFVNLTPHTINLQLEDKMFAFPSEGNCRVSVQQNKDSELEIDGHKVPVVVNSYGKVEGLPRPEKDVTYIVSLMVLQAIGGRPDIFAPDTGSTAIRKDGQIVAVRQFVKNR